MSIWGKVNRELTICKDQKRSEKMIKSTMNWKSTKIRKRSEKMINHELKIYKDQKISDSERSEKMMDHEWICKDGSKYQGEKLLSLSFRKTWSLCFKCLHEVRYIRRKEREKHLCSIQDWNYLKVRQKPSCSYGWAAWKQPTGIAPGDSPPVDKKIYLIRKRNGGEAV